MNAMVCPRCKTGADVVALEDGVWMCTACVIEFDVDGRARGGYVEVGKIGLFLDGSPSEPLFTAGVSASSPRKDGTVTIEIRMDSVRTLDELYQKLRRVVDGKNAVPTDDGGNGNG